MLDFFVYAIGLVIYYDLYVYTCNIYAASPTDEILFFLGRPTLATPFLHFLHQHIYAIWGSRFQVWKLHHEKKINLTQPNIQHKEEK